MEEALISKHHLTTQPIQFNGVDGLLIESPNVQKDRGALLNVHGGGFTMGTARERTALLAAAETNLPVYSINYSRAPEAAVPVALNEVVAFYQGFLDQVGDQPTFMMGSSAGSNLVVAAQLKLHALGLPLPAANIIFCPALDISGNGDSAVFNNRRDVMSAHLALRIAQRYIQGADPTSPEVSPLYGELGPWFPPTFMSSGTRDIMLSNVVRFSAKLKDANIPFQAVIKEGMWHGFNWEATLPEAIDTRQQAWQFILPYQNY
ncbi:alpha/beta hydrolase fold domain-containing protein [Levilactobacillus bambusae]|uniref:alpha/beta hydrolase fold domain-containing protein n=1 Tax=Levilactobacillus bambusae TaxID=2024736 RepID=UPI001CDAF4F6|nr:alpha/beta hydrolase fold domain-containing protein [Levilactobacillus bambusae]